MAIDYNDRLVRFTELKYNLINKKISYYIAQRYFLSEDYENIEKLSKSESMIIWKMLERNIKEGYYGLSRKTCTYCIQDSLSSKKCARCDWAKYHKNCREEDGDFQLLEQAFKDRRIESISNQEYKRILKEVKKDNL